MSQLGVNAYKSGKPLMVYKDTVMIPPLGMVDDLLTMNYCGTETVVSNTINNSFVESKRLELGSNKCHRIHVGKFTDNCHDLKVHSEKMKDSKIHFLLIIFRRLKVKWWKAAAS